MQETSTISTYHCKLFFLFKYIEVCIAKHHHKYFPVDIAFYNYFNTM